MTKWLTQDQQTVWRLWLEVVQRQMVCSHDGNRILAIDLDGQRRRVALRGFFGGAQHSIRLP